MRFALAVALLLATGCSTAPVASLSEALVTPTARPLAPEPHYVAVLPFEDARPNVVRQNGGNAVPLLGLFLQGYGDIHERPETTTSEVWFGNFMSGSLADDLPREIANVLTATGTARDATFIVGGADGGADLRRYDYILSGKLKASPLEDELWDYGLNVFTIVDASIVPHALGLPFARRSASVTFDAELREQSSGRLMWKATVVTPRVRAVEGLYYGHKVGGSQPYAGVIGESVRRAMPNLAKKLGAAMATEHAKPQG